MQNQGVAVARSALDQNKENSVHHLPHQHSQHGHAALKANEGIKKKAPLGMLQGQNGSTGNPSLASRASVDVKKSETLQTGSKSSSNVQVLQQEQPPVPLETVVPVLPSPQVQAPQMSADYENMDAEARKAALDNLRKKLGVRGSKRPSEIVSGAPAVASSQGVLAVPRPSISTPLSMGSSLSVS
jgi:hypothetical protein